jgi:hypothetical protein
MIWKIFDTRGGKLSHAFANDSSRTTLCGILFRSSQVSNAEILHGHGDRCIRCRRAALRAAQEQRAAFSAFDRYLSTYEQVLLEKDPSADVTETVRVQLAMVKVIAAHNREDRAATNKAMSDFRNMILKRTKETT